MHEHSYHRKRDINYRMIRIRNSHREKSDRLVIILIFAACNSNLEFEFPIRRGKQRVFRIRGD